MKDLPVELIATICEYLQSVDLFYIFQLNKKFNFLSSNFEFWAVIYKNYSNFFDAFLVELNDELRELVSLSLIDRNILFPQLGNFNKFISNVSYKDLTRLILQSNKGDFEPHYFSLFSKKCIWDLWRIKIARNLNYMTFRQLIFLNQNVECCFSNLEIVAVYSPLIAIIKNSTLEIYKLENTINNLSSYQNENFNLIKERKYANVALNLISYLKLSDLFNRYEIESQFNFEFDYTRNIIKWMFYNTKLIFFVTKKYGIYLLEIYQKKTFVLKKCLTNNDEDISTKVNFFVLSNNLLVFGFEDGHIDLWEICFINNKISINKFDQILIIKPYATINFEYKYIQKTLTSDFDNWVSPLVCINTSYNSNLLLAMYKGIVNEIKIFSIKKSVFNDRPILIRKIPLSSNVQTCQLEPKGRFVVCLDSNTEVNPKTRFYSIKTGELLSEFDFRIIGLKFTPCGNFMIGGHSKNFCSFISHQGNDYFNIYSKNNNSSTFSSFISIWDVPSLNKIFTFDYKDSKQILNIYFSRTRSSTCIITKVYEQSNVYEVNSSNITSKIYFLCHDLFSQFESEHVTYFFLNKKENFNRIFIEKKDYENEIRNKKKLDEKKYFDLDEEIQSNRSRDQQTLKLLNILYDNFKLICSLFKQGFIPKIYSNVDPKIKSAHSFNIEMQNKLNFESENFFPELDLLYKNSTYLGKNKIENILLNEFFQFKKNKASI